MFSFRCNDKWNSKKKGYPLLVLNADKMSEVSVSETERV
ncbi:hypothetical protein UC317_1838 [Lactococcus lactis subsp. lactis]|uniref:Uncharacterized protein n=1 Tax=Lactococcus lactis subsp. lactis TaxID=1360 RepID=A0A0V8EDM8_LACLL|nr:hypothetical protein N42_2740 [Lactococcus lactis subsp. lactis]KSU32175.1 hypothetical protein UC317_1838 [Lactococcus lactis subsp. lactis]CDI47532.1 hypothetical protein BN927_02125 [Lactococcus lactis subsp. lactis Dephy 1]